MAWRAVPMFPPWFQMDRSNRIDNFFVFGVLLPLLLLPLLLLLLLRPILLQLLLLLPLRLPLFLLWLLNLDPSPLS